MIPLIHIFMTQKQQDYSLLRAEAIDQLEERACLARKMT